MDRFVALARTGVDYQMASGNSPVLWLCTFNYPIIAICAITNFALPSDNFISSVRTQ